MRYRSVRPDDTAIREAMKKVASERRRFGYRRIHVMLDRQGIVMNLKKLRRLYREEKLTVRKRGGRKRALGTRRPLALPSRPNERWSLDFVSDAFTDGRRFRVLAVVDDFTREYLCLIADTSGRAACSRAGQPHRQTGKAEDDRLGQRHGDAQYGRSQMAPGNKCRVALHRPPASRYRTVSSRASTAAFETNASTKPCSRRSPTHEPLSPHGRRITIETDRTHRWATSLPASSQ